MGRTFFGERAHVSIDARWEGRADSTSDCNRVVLVSMNFKVGILHAV
jgi:hypothetical protein